MMVLAHLSDPHLGPLPTPRLGELASKRLLGLLNWYRKRRRVHRPETLAVLLRDLNAQAVDHVAVTGDLVNIALPEEFARARAWLEARGSPHDLTLVPGNHDAYVRAAASWPAKYWAPYMRADDGELCVPFVRRRGAVALVGLSSAVPSPPVMATGALGAEQIARLSTILAQLAQQELFRIVLVHHPPHGPESRKWKRLIDSEALRAALARAGAELVLHGHDHEHAVSAVDGPQGRIPVIGVPSASAAADCGCDAAAYNLYRIDGAPGAWTCEAVTRGLAPDGRVGELRRLMLWPREL